MCGKPVAAGDEVAVASHANSLAAMPRVQAATLRRVARKLEFSDSTPYTPLDRSASLAQDADRGKFEGVDGGGQQ